MRSEQDNQAGVSLKLAAWGGLFFMHFPILVIVLYAFNDTAFLALPPHGLSFKWFINFFAIARLV